MINSREDKQESNASIVICLILYVDKMHHNVKLENTIKYSIETFKISKICTCKN